jgi:hypothetical protein
MRDPLSMSPLVGTVDCGPGPRFLLAGRLRVSFEKALSLRPGPVREKWAKQE